MASTSKRLRSAAWHLTIVEAKLVLVGLSVVAEAIVGNSGLRTDREAASSYVRSSSHHEEKLIAGLLK